MTNIVVPTDYQIRIILFKTIYIVLKVGHVLQFVIQSFNIGPRGQVKAHYRYPVKVRPQVATFGIHVFDPGTELHMIGLLLGENRHPAVPFFFSAKPIVIGVACLFKKFQIQLFFQCLNFLKADYIRVCLYKPFQKSLADSSPDTIYIIGSYFQNFQFWAKIRNEGELLKPICRSPGFLPESRPGILADRRTLAPYKAELVKPSIFIFLLILAICPASGQQKQQDSITYLKEVVVGGSLEKVSPVGLGPVEVLSERGINSQNPTDFASTLNQVPGLYFLSGALNTNRITIRGVGARTPFGTDKLRMYYNDIPVTNGTGFSTLEAFDLQNLSTIEVVKGPKSGAYGAALGGALLLRSDPRAQAGALLENRMSAGSYGLFKNNLSLTYKDSIISTEIRYNRMTTRGYRQNNNFDRDGLLVNLGMQAGKSHQLNLLLNYIDYTAQIPSSLSETDFMEDPTQAAFTWNAAQGFEANKYTLLGLSDRVRLGDNWQQTASVFVSYLDHYEPRPFNILDEYTFGYGFRSVVNGDFKLWEQNFNLRFGGEFYRDQYNWSTYENLYESNPDEGSLQGDRISRNREFRSQLYLFSSLQWDLTSRLSVQGGVSLNKTKYDFRDLFTADGTDTSARRNFEPILLPSLDIRYTADSGSWYYLNLSRGFSNPSLEESLNPDGIINPDISQEKGWNYEIGGRWYLPRTGFQASLSLYQMDITDLLVAERVGQDQFIGRNAGSTRHRGAEAALQYSLRPLEGFLISPFISYTLNDHYFREFSDADGDYSGNPLTGVPKHRVFAGLKLQLNAGWYGNISYQYVDAISLRDENTLYSQPYQLVNTQLGYRSRLWENLLLGVELGLNNLLDARYASSVLINANSFGGSEPRYYYPGNDRNYYLGLNLVYSL